MRTTTVWPANRVKYSSGTFDNNSNNSITHLHLYNIISHNNITIINNNIYRHRLVRVHLYKIFYGCIVITTQCSHIYIIILLYTLCSVSAGTSSVVLLYFLNVQSILYIIVPICMPYEYNIIQSGISKIAV